jgi:chromosome segregation ATPase
MADENLVLRQLRELREENQTHFATINGKMAALDEKVGSLATGMVSLRREMRELSDTVQPLAIALTHLDQRVARIEDRLTNMETHLPGPAE